MTLALIKKGLRRLLPKRNLPNTPSEAAYDVWADNYDAQPDNLMMHLDEQIFTNLLSGINLEGKTVADMGCGTGRHWAKIFAQSPLLLTGYDVSAGMLAKLKEKFPQVATIKIPDAGLPKMKSASLDVLLSTLTIAHLPDLDATINNWVMALKPDADIIITDFHPEALAVGGRRTFTHKDGQVSVKNYVHPVEQIIQKFAVHGFTVSALEERFVDESVKPFYEKQNALSVYEKFKGRPIIYGIHLTRTNAAE